MGHRLLGSDAAWCPAIYAADKVTSGDIKMNGKKVKIGEPIHAMKLGIGYLPEDRKGDGIIAELSVRDNIILATQVTKGFFKPLSRKQAEAFADEYIKRLNKTASTNTRSNPFPAATSRRSSWPAGFSRTPSTSSSMSPRGESMSGPRWRFKSSCSSSPKTESA